MAGILKSTRVRESSTGRAMPSADRSRIIRPAYPGAALGRLETHPQPFGPARHLRAASNFAVGEVGSDEIDQGGTGLNGIRRRQRVSENARLNVVARDRVAEHRALEVIQHDQEGSQGLVLHIAGKPGTADEAQMQQPADATTLIVQAKSQSSMQISDHEQGFGRNVISVRRDQQFLEIFCHVSDPLIAIAMLH